MAVSQIFFVFCGFLKMFLCFVCMCVCVLCFFPGEGNGNPLLLLPGNSHGTKDPGRLVHGVAKSWPRLSDFIYLLTYFLCFYGIEVYLPGFCRR